MANTIQIKRSSTSGNTPTLAAGELGVNLADSKLYVGNGSTNVLLNPSASTSYLPIAGGTLTGGLTLQESDGRSTLTLVGAKTADGNYGDILGSNNSGAGRAQISFRRISNDDATGILFYTEATGASMSESMRIDSNGVTSYNNLTVGGYLSIGGNTYPTTDGTLLGNVAKRWALMATTGNFTGNITAANITSTGDFTIDSGDGIILDADGGAISLKDNGTTFGILEKATNDLVISNPIDDANILFKYKDGGTVKTALTLNGSGDFAAFPSGLVVTGALSAIGNINLSADLSLNDSGKIKLGIGDDLEIYHNGSDSIIADSGTGGIKIDSNYTAIRSANGSETAAKFLENGAVELYHDNSKKFETTSTGAAVTGTLTATGGTLTGDLTVSGSVYLNDTNTRIVEGGSNSVRLQTNSGYVDVGPQNTSYSHFQTDRSRFYFNKELIVDTGIIRSYNEDLQLDASFHGAAAKNIRFRTGNVEKIRMDTDGALLIDTTSKGTSTGKLYAGSPYTSSSAIAQFNGFLRFGFALTHDATRGLYPNVSGQGSIGMDSARYGKGFFQRLDIGVANDGEGTVFGDLVVKQQGDTNADGFAVVGTTGNPSLRLWTDVNGNRKINAGGTEVISFTTSAISLLHPVSIGQSAAPSGNNKLEVYNTSGNYNAVFKNSGQATIEVKGGEASSARIRLIADEGDDVNNADHFQLIHETSNNFELQRYNTTSGWVWKWKLDSSDNVHQTGNLTVGGDLDLGGNLIVGEGGNNKSIKVRHIDGKDYDSDDASGLFLNNSNQQPVYVGNPNNNADFYVRGAADVTGNLTVGGNLNLTGGLVVDGASTLGDSNDTTSINGALVVSGNAYGPSLGALAVGAGLNVTGAGSFSGNLTVHGNTFLGNALADTTTVYGNLVLNDTAYPSSNSVQLGYSTNRFGYVYSEAGDFSGNLTVGGTATVQPSAGDGILTLKNSAASQILRIDQNSIRTTTTHNITLFTDGNSNQLRLSSDGNVGIGTASPATGKKLHVAGSVQADSSIIINNTAFAGKFAGFGTGPLPAFLGGSPLFHWTTYNSAGSATLSNFAIMVDDGGDVSFGNTTSSSLPRSLYLDTSGNLGVGASPSYLLDLESTATGLTHNLKLNKSSTTGDYAEIAFQLWSGAGTGLNTFGGSGTSRPSVVLRALNENGGSAAGAFVVGTFTGGSTNSTLTEKFRITSAGNVGIGTASPNYKLQVVGTFRASDSGYFAKTSGTGLSVDHGTSFGTITSDAHSFKGNVDIRSATGSVGLTVGNTTGDTRLQITSSENSDVTLNVGDASDMGTSRSLIFKTGNSHRMSLTSTGLGIGVANPTNTLEVKGPNTVAPFKIVNSSNSDRRFLQISSSSNYPRLTLYNSSEASTVHLDTNGSSYINGGSLGIGTTSPNGKLTIHTGTNSNGLLIYEDTNDSLTHNLYIDGSDQGVLDLRNASNAVKVQLHTGGHSFFTGGSVGINTSVPYNPLHVNGNGRINSLLVGNSAANNTPAAALHIKSSGTAAVLRIEDSDSSNQVYDFLCDQGSGLSIIDKGTGSSTNTRLQIDTNGNATFSGAVTASSFNGALIDSTIGAYVSTHGAAQDRPVGWYTIATNGGHRAIARFGLRDTRSGDHQSVIFYASHNYGQNHSNVITVLHASHYSGNPYRYIRIKENGTYDGAVLQVYIDDATNDLDAYLLGDNFQANGWVLKDWIVDANDPGGVNNYSSMTAKGQVDLNQVAQGGIVTTGDFYGGGDTTQYKLATENWVEQTAKSANSHLLDGIDSTSFVRSDADDTVSKQLTFPSAYGDRPVLLGGFFSRLTNDGDADIWGISETFYPSNSTASNAWGIRWSSSPNEIQFVGNGSNKFRIDLDTAGKIYYDDNEIATQAWVNAQNFSTTTGDITGVTAGTGLTGGGTSGSVTLNVDEANVNHDNLSGYDAAQHRVINDSSTNSQTELWSAYQITTELGTKSDTSHTHSAATTTSNGFMSSTDKSKLDGLSNYSHPSHPGDDFAVDTGALTGAIIVSDIDINVTTDTLGHVTDCNGSVSTRTLNWNDLPNISGLDPLP